MSLDYTNYHFTVKDLLLFSAEAVLIIALLDLLFYRSLPAFFLMLPLLPLYFRLRKQQKIAERKARLRDGLAPFLHALTFHLRAGYSVENAFPEVSRYVLATLGENHPMTVELARITRGLRRGQRVEALLADLAQRSDLEELSQLSSVFGYAKRAGGDLTQIIENASARLAAKCETDLAIEGMIAAKRMEQRLMAAMPPLIILYLSFASPELIAPLYTSTAGALTMTIVLALYAAAVFLGHRFTTIEV